MVLKLPLTRAASRKGLHRYKGFWVAAGETGATSFEVELGKVAEVGVGERFGLGPERCIERLTRVGETAGVRSRRYCAPYGIQERHERYRRQDDV